MIIDKFKKELYSILIGKTIYDINYMQEQNAIHIKLSENGNKTKPDKYYRLIINIYNGELMVSYSKPNE